MSVAVGRRFPAGRFLAAVLALVTGPASFGAQDALDAKVNQVFADIEANEPGCAVGVMRGGEPVLVRGYGAANLEYGIPITSGSIFHVASVSKQFTAMAVALLVADGKVSWQDDIRTHVPEVPDFGKTITLRHLVNHTSGIRDASGRVDGFTASTGRVRLVRFDRVGARAQGEARR